MKEYHRRLLTCSLRKCKRWSRSRSIWGCSSHQSRCSPAWYLCGRSACREDT